MVNATNPKIAGIEPATSRFPWPTLNLDRATLIACVTRCRAEGVTYGLGAKAPSPAAPPGNAPGGFTRIDCSGFIGWALAQATGGHFTTLFDLGSVEQHDWIAAHGFKPSSPPAATLHDGALRLAILRPADGGGIGHILLALDGETIESHGGLGPDRRVWDTAAHPFLAKCAVYVLSPPTG